MINSVWEIPKGIILYNFLAVSKVKKLTKSRLVNTITLLTAVVIILLCALTLYLWQHNAAIKKQLDYYTILDEDNLIWKEFLRVDLQIIIVLGDHLFSLNTITI